MDRTHAAQELDIAIRAAARLASPKQPSRDVARELYENESAAIAPFIDEWVIEKLAVLIGKHRAKARREANPQLVFEDMLGMKGLPAVYRPEEGRLVRRTDFTINTFRKLASKLRAQESPALTRVHQAIALMSKYTTKDKDITWGEVVQREAEKFPRKREARG